jgi:hypothetical protein
MEKSHFQWTNFWGAGHTIDEFHLDLQIVDENGQEKLLFEPGVKKRWLLLKLLDDDYLGSVMTEQKYEVNSKSAIG